MTLCNASLFDRVQSLLEGYIKQGLVPPEFPFWIGNDLWANLRKEIVAIKVTEKVFVDEYIELWLDSQELADEIYGYLMEILPLPLQHLAADLYGIIYAFFPELKTEISRPVEVSTVVPYTVDEMKRHIKDWKWRVSHLYKVVNEHGQVVPFRPNPAQAHIINNIHTKNWILKSRQHGATTLNSYILLDQALFNAHKNAVIIAHSIRESAEMFRTKVDFAYRTLPAVLRDALYTQTKNVKAIELSNGSQIRVTVSSRGGTAQYILITELGYLYWYSPARADEVVTGTLHAAHRGNYVMVESTAYGMTGFYDRTMRIKTENDAAAISGVPLDLAQFKFFFLPWFMDKKNQATPRTLTEKEEEYFTRVETEQRVKLKPSQKAWYVIKLREEGPAKLWREHPSTPDEAFRASTEGTFYSEEMAKVFSDSRVKPGLYRPDLPVHVAWDLGRGDLMVLIFFQVEGLRRWALHTYANNAHGLDHYITYIQNSKYGFTPQMKLFLPHDSSHSELTLKTGEDRLSYLSNLPLVYKNGFAGLVRDLSIVRIPRVTSKLDDIDMLRRALEFWWFEAKPTDDQSGQQASGVTMLLKSLSNYKRKFDQEKMVFANAPDHDISSHYVDAMMCAEHGARGEGQRYSRSNALPY